LQHDIVNCRLLARFFAAQPRRDLLVDVRDRARHAFAEKPFAAVPQLDSFMNPGGGPGRHRRPSDHPFL